MTLALDTTGLAELCEANDVAYLGVFGSYARGDFGPDSDIDVLYVFPSARG